MSISFDKEITFLGNIPGFGDYLATALRGIRDGVNNLGQNIAVDPAGNLPDPPPNSFLLANSQQQVYIEDTSLEVYQRYLLDHVENWLSDPRVPRLLKTTVM